MPLLLFFLVPLISSFALLGFAESNNRLKILLFVAVSGLANGAIFYRLDHVEPLQIVLISFAMPLLVLIYALASPVDLDMHFPNN